MRFFLAFILIFITYGPTFAQLRVHQDGKITIGTTTPYTGSKLMIQGGLEKGLFINCTHNSDWTQSSSVQVSKALTVSWAVRWNNSDRFWVQGNGTIVAKDAYFYSDARMKQDVRPITSALDRLGKIDGVSFAYKPEEQCSDCGAVVADDAILERHFGFIAQDIGKIFPEVVTQTPDKMYVLSY